MGSLELIMKLVLLVLIVNYVSAAFEGGRVFEVNHKFAGKERNLKDFKAHDSKRHRRNLLAGIDIPVGGNGQPTGTGLYYTKIGIGSPLKNYSVHIDTGSDLLWVKCIQCRNCPKKSGLGVGLRLYDSQSSSSGEIVKCDDDFCTYINQGPNPGCLPNSLCPYDLQYGDGSATDGYYVKDVLGFSQVSGNLQTSIGNASVYFGCGVHQTGDLIDSDEALDGILGFGNASSSVISQLASSGIVSKKFAHCLDATKGGGIFAIGDVVHPKVNTTPLVLDQSHYNVDMEAVKVGNTVLKLPKQVFEARGGSGTIIDSGTTLVYLPEVIYDPLMEMIISSQPGLTLYNVDNIYSCFQYSGSVDDGFPTVTFQFRNKLEMVVPPHEYLFLTKSEGWEWCIGWQNSANLARGAQDTIILGDLVLSNKLVLYDLENQVIGWTNYNCSSTIEVKDEKSGSVYSVGAHDISSSVALQLDPPSFTIILLITYIWYCLIQ